MTSRHLLLFVGAMLISTSVAVPTLVAQIANADRTKGPVSSTSGIISGGKYYVTVDGHSVSGDATTIRDLSPEQIAELKKTCKKSDEDAALAYARGVWGTSPISWGDPYNSTTNNGDGTWACFSHGHSWQDVHGCSAATLLAGWNNTHLTRCLELRALKTLEWDRSVGHDDMGNWPSSKLHGVTSSNR